MVSAKKLRRDPWQDRQPQYQPIPSNVKRWPAKKNRKAWCRGKPGVEHQPETVRHHYFTGQSGCGTTPWKSWVTGDYWQCFHAIRCTDCGKYLKPHLKKEECPVWMESHA